jgi:hypothetical protein
MHSLLFHMKLEPTHELVSGRLILLEDGKYIDTYLATSGVREMQGKNDQDNSGLGPLPSCLELGGKSYTVATAPLNMPAVKGVEGNFYKINPHLVSIWGRQRGDFGIHRDANLPGSAGCIVLTSQKGWDAFQQRMSAIAKSGSKELPLVVSYS